MTLIEGMYPLEINDGLAGVGTCSEPTALGRRIFIT